MVLTKDLIDIYKITRSNKKRSDDSIIFEMHCERNIKKLESDIQNRTLRPEAYSFIADPKTKPREVFACDFATRIVHHYIVERLRPFAESRLTNRSFNNRKGFGPDVAVNQFLSDLYEVSEGWTKEAWVVSVDIKGYFPNIRQDIVYRQLREIIDPCYDGYDLDELHYMLQVSIFTNLTKNCRRISPITEWSLIPDYKSLFKKSDGIGGAIGCLIWQNGLNYYLHKLDHKMVNVYKLHYLRYVDDIKWITPNKELMLAMLEEVRRDLKELHCTLHPKKMSCQRATANLKFIGKHIHKDRTHCSNKIFWHAKHAISMFNRKPCPELIEPFLCSINSFLGLYKNVTNYKEIVRIVGLVDDRWKDFIYFDKTRLCFNAKNEYKHVDLLCRKYRLKKKKLKKVKKKKNYGNSRKDFGSGIRTE